MKELAEKIGGLGCLIVAIYLYLHGHTHPLVVILGVLGALEAL